MMKKLLKLENKKHQKFFKRTSKTIKNNNNLTFISTFNPNNSKIFDFVKSGVNTMVENNVNGFKSIRLIHAKLQSPNQKEV